MGTEKNHNAAPRRARRGFSDRLEFRRGQVDARAGRAPATIQAQYIAGYAAGKRQLRATKKAETEARKQSSSSAGLG